MRFHIVTLFPDAFRGPLDVSILKRARERGLVDVRLYQLRDYTHDRHHVTDDAPFGGGPGMVLKPEPLFEAVEGIRRSVRAEGRPSLEGPLPVVLLDPQGRLLTQAVAREMASHEEIVLVCGHYEGVDERVRERLVTDEISIGDYVLTGGELPAMVLVEAVARLVPGVLGSEDSAPHDSHAQGLLQYPQYTRPATFQGWSVPEVLLSGDHKQIDLWRRRQSLLRTLRRRPDLLAATDLTAAERAFLKSRAAAGEGQPPPVGNVE
ncbi:MAG: tRNA (guanosine(37)-N1)-methyltransferase TrmD [Dehalococcoidia bacterium]|nr:tRNA (guanosine(37)-N1)-methyltransferase TrmD [Dehalococcoidia bacterium]